MNTKKNKNKVVLPEPEFEEEPQPGSSSPEPAKKPSNSTLILIGVLSLAVIVVAIVLLLSAKNQPNPATASNNADAPVAKDNREPKQPEEEPETDDPYEPKTEQPETIDREYETVQVAYFGELQCIRETTNDNWNHCVLPNEKVLNAEDGSTYSLSSPNSEVTTTRGIASSKEVGEDEIVLERNGNSFIVTISGTYTTINGRPNDEDSHSYAIGFEQTIQQAVVVGFGQSPGYEVVFYITDGGDLYYTQLKQLVLGDIAPKKFEPASGVVAIFAGGTCSVGCGHTNYAVRADGSAYDLSELGV